MSTYIDSKDNGADPGYSWVEHTRRNLAWHYGPERADAIIVGNDQAARSDIAGWTRLGQRSAA